MCSKIHYKRRGVTALLAILFTLLTLYASSASAQTTTFTYQGRLTDTSMTASGTYDFQFRLYDAAGGNNQIGTVITRSGVTVTNGAFTVQLDFGAAAFPGADRYLEVDVKKSSDTAYTTLTPRQQVTSTPYAIQSLNAMNATNATNLGGAAANQFVQTNDARLSDSRTPTAGSNNYIQNSTTTQFGADFNISGSGTTGGRTAAAGLSITAPANDKAIEVAAGRIILSYATVAGGTTSGNAGTIPNTAAVIEISDNGAGGSGATATLPATAENGTVIVIGTSDADGAVVFGVSGGTSYAFNANQSARFTRIAGTWKFTGQ